MSKSKSQKKREANQKAAQGATPGWLENQQRETNAKDQDDRDNEQDPPSVVKIKMLSNYRDVAKKGDVVEFDNQKAAELVRLKRAEYLASANVEEKEEESETGSESDFETGREASDE